jgi:hypothetical protein
MPFRSARLLAQKVKHNNTTFDVRSGDEAAIELLWLSMLQLLVGVNWYYMISGTEQSRRARAFGDD